MRKMFRRAAWISTFFLFSALHCSVPLSSGGSSSETVIGKVVNYDGSPACSTIVILYPADFDPIRDFKLVQPTSDTTDATGAYSVEAFGSTGNYSIVATKLNSGTRALVSGINFNGTTICAKDAVLSKPGIIIIAAPDTADVENGYLYIPGTGISVSLSGDRKVLIYQVPAGTIVSVNYASRTSSSASSVLAAGIKVVSSDTTVISYPQWRYSRRLYLNTTVSGAGVSGTVVNFPVLIRLTAANFDFTQARNNGEDIRFTKRDNTFLPYEIERWDAVAKLAEVWMKVDTVHGNDSTQAITMYWDNINAPAQSNSSAVFDTGSGFQGVWHLSGPGNANAGDATLHHYDGTPTDTAPQTTPGVIGAALQFDGNANGLVMKNTAHSPLNFPRPGTYTFSAWVYVDTVYDADEFIAGKGYDQYALRIKGSKSYPSSLFALSEYVDAPVYGSEMRVAQVVTGQWKYIVGIRDTANSYLFIDGRCIDSSGTIFYSKGDVQDSTNFSIGRCAASYPAPANSNNYLAFKGKIDEVRIAAVHFSADWVKLSYMNQKEQDALVRW